MREEQHEVIASWERRWLAIQGAMLVVFVIFMAVALTIQGEHIAHLADRGTPEEVGNLEMFRNPGVVQQSTNQFDVHMVAQAFSFTPSRVQLPAGATATFQMTSRDVLHGFQVQDTNINVELIPGDISRFSYTFDSPGSYRVTCNEYCGIGHQNMLATIEVLDRQAYAEARAAAEEAPGVDGAAGPAQESVALGSDVYAANCAGCHQADGTGLAGAFPPLTEHAAHIYEVEGGREYLVDVLLYGLEGAISVEGTTYDGVMPAWSQLSDEEVAGTLDYVLQSFGNAEILGDDFEPYEPAEVADQRANALTPQQVLEAREALELPQ